MKTFTKISMAAFLSLTLISATGCNTVSGFGEDLQKAGEAIQKSGE